MSIKKYFESAKTMRNAQVLEARLWKTLDKHFDDFKEHHKEEYEELCDCLFMGVNGLHFNEDMLEKAYTGMVNDNGTSVPHWSLSEVDRQAKIAGIRLGEFNIYDLAYTVNMLYSDYCDVLGDEPKTYFLLAKKFLNDKDAPNGGSEKAMIYYRAIKKSK